MNTRVIPPPPPPRRQEPAPEPPREAEARPSEIDRMLCEGLVNKVLARAQTDVALPMYFQPFVTQPFARTIDGCRCDLDDGRYCIITPTQVTFGNLARSGGERRVPL